MSVVILSTGYYPDPDIGKPISSGSIYVGTVDLDPEIVANQKQISVLQEDGSEVAVTQPIRTGAGGVPVYNGSPVTIIAASPYSLKVNDSTGVQKIYSPSNTGSSQANEDWSQEGAAVAFDSASTFTVAGDVTSVYTVHRAIKLTQTADDTGFVVSSVYAGGPDETTVTVRVATVDSGLTTVEYGQEVASSPGGSSEDFHANIVGNVTGAVTGTLNTYDTGNDSGEIPVSNGTVNTNLNADKLDGLDASDFLGSAANGFQEITADGNFTVPANVNRIFVQGCANGGGGGEGVSGADGGGGGGGGGEWVDYYPMQTTPGEDVAIAGIATASGGSGAGGTNGASGANVTITTLLETLTLTGGDGGSGGAAGVGGAGGSLTTLNPMFSQDGGDGAGTAGGIAEDGESNHFYAGGAAGVGGGLVEGGGGAGGRFGVGAAGGALNTAGSSAAANTGAGGGGGAANQADGGDGGSGKIIIYW
jgi:hypothetical protein